MNSSALRAFVTPRPATPQLALGEVLFPTPGAFVISGPQLGVLESQAVLTLRPCSSGQTPPGRVEGHLTCASTRTPDKLGSVPLSTCCPSQVPTSCLSGCLFTGVAHTTMGTQSLPSLLVGSTGYNSDQLGGRGAEDKACGEGSGAALPLGELPPTCVFSHREALLILSFQGFRET